MKIKIDEQVGFSSLLFDTLFGLVFYFSIDSVLDIKEPINLVFYLFSIIILVHWWLTYKSCDDAYGKDVSDSVLDLFIGITQLMLIEFIVLTSKSFDYILTTKFLLALIFVDLIWGIIWFYIGKWRSKNILEAHFKDKELKNNIKIDLIGLIIFMLLLLLSYYFLLSSILFVSIFIAFYVVYIVCSFRYKIIDIDFF